MRPAGRASHARKCGRIGGIEDRVSTARPRIIFPGDCLHREESRRLSQPPDPIDHAALSFGRENLTKSTRRLAAGQKGEYSRPRLLIFGGVPDGAGRQIGAVGAWPASPPPERGLKLEQEARRVAILERGNRVHLLRRKSRIEVHVTKRRCRKCSDAEIAGQLGSSSLILDRHSHAVDVLANRSNGGLHDHVAAKPFDQRARQAIVTSLDSIELAAGPETDHGQLIDDRQQREQLRIREVESAQRSNSGPQTRIARRPDRASSIPARAPAVARSPSPTACQPGSSPQPLAAEGVLNSLSVPSIGRIRF